MMRNLFVPDYRVHQILAIFVFFSLDSIGGSILRGVCRMYPRLYDCGGGSMGRFYSMDSDD